MACILRIYKPLRLVESEHDLYNDEAVQSICVNDRCEDAEDRRLSQFALESGQSAHRHASHRIRIKASNHNAYQSYNPCSEYGAHHAAVNSLHTVGRRKTAKIEKTEDHGGDYRDERQPGSRSSDGPSPLQLVQGG